MENIHKNGVGMGKNGVGMGKNKVEMGKKGVEMGRNKVEMDRNPLRTGSKWSKDVFKMQFKKNSICSEDGFKILWGTDSNTTRTNSK